MADVSRGWTSSTVTPLYLRAGAGSTPIGSGGVSGGAVRKPTSTYKYAATSPAKTAAEVKPEQLTATSPAFSAAPAKTYTAEDFKITGTQLADPSLGSRAYASPSQAMPVDAPITASVYQGYNIPAFLQNSIQALNEEQLQKRVAQQTMLDRLFKAAQGGDYTAWEALRAAAIQPGAKATFGSYVVSPDVQSEQAKTIAATTEKTKAETQAVEQPNYLLFQLQQAQAQRAKLGSPGFGAYEGSTQQALDRKIMDLQAQLKSDSAAVQIATAAARPNVLKQSAWVSPMAPGVALPMI